MTSGPSVQTLHRWRLVDGRGQVVGRLASRVATLLMGKTKPTYSPHLDHGDNVVLVNAAEIKFTGKKYENKLYRWHSGYPGGLKTKTPREFTEVKDRPEEIIARAVSGMLPKNRLRDDRMRRLKIFKGPLVGVEAMSHFVFPSTPATVKKRASPQSWDVKQRVEKASRSSSSSST